MIPVNILCLQNSCIVIKRLVTTLLDLVKLVILHFLKQAMEVLFTSAKLAPLTMNIGIKIIYA